jgi:hypothetical protein
VVDAQAVHDLLADGRFVGYVAQRRQQALLGVASELLAGLTGRRYGFAADFQIVDRLTGQPRSTRTLSGGESFLASLTLALGMVELAGRAGGRLDAVFLDEAFGGLDTTSLDAAIDALETRAAAGGRADHRRARRAGHAGRQRGRLAFNLRAGRGGRPGTRRHHRSRPARLAVGSWPGAGFDFTPRACEAGCRAEEPQMHRPRLSEQTSIVAATLRFGIRRGQ